MMQLPPFLKAGDRVAIAAPARWVSEGDMDFFMQALNEQGYKIEPGSIYKQHHQYSGSDTERLGDLQSMLDNPEVKAIFCARGGYGTARLIKGIDLISFVMNPKWIAGFSDITALHSFILMKTGIAVMHSVMPYTLRDSGDLNNTGLSSLLEALRGNFPSYEIPFDEHNRNGKAEGILLGGNLSVLYSMTGSPYQIPTKGAILFLEDVDEYLYHIDRMMLNLKMAGMLKHLNGMIIGGMTDMKDNDVPFGKSPYEIIREAVEPYEFPVCFGFPAGHQDPNLALVLGRKVLLEVGPGGCKMKYRE